MDPKRKVLLEFFIDYVTQENTIDFLIDLMEPDLRADAIVFFKGRQKRLSEEREFSIDKNNLVTALRINVKAAAFLDPESFTDEEVDFFFRRSINTTTAVASIT